MYKNKFASQYFFCFSVCCSIILITSSFFFSLNSIPYLFMIVFLNLSWTYYFTRANRRYILPIIWLIFFNLGYVLSMSSSMIDPEAATIGISNALAVGGLFSDEHLEIITSVIFFGFLGVYLATLFFEKLFSKNTFEAIDEKYLHGISEEKILFLGGTWFLISILIICLMWYLGIGRTGLPPETILPLKLGGILVYVKNIVIPFLGFYFFILANRTKKYKIVFIIFLSLSFIGVLGGIAFISRSFFIFMVFPCLLYMIFFGKKNIARFTYQAALVAIFLLLILVPSIDYLRSYLFTGIDPPLIFSDDFNVHSFNILESLGNVVNLATGRILGFRELLAVTVYDQNDFFAPVKIFFMDIEFLDELNYELYGFIPDASGNTAFGMAYGLWGMLFLSGSFFIVFLGTFLATSVILTFEEIFIQIGYKELSLFMAVNMGLWIWGGIDYFLLSRLVITALFCFLLIGIFKLRRKFKTNE